MKFWKLHKGSRIIFDAFIAVKIIIKAFQGGNLSHDSTFFVHDFLLFIIEAVLKVFHIFLKIRN